MQLRPGDGNVIRRGGNIVVQRGEKWDAVWGVGPIDAWRARRAATEALARARASGLPGMHNGPADAFRHAYWNCRMTQAIGADQAETIATNHERHGGGPANENTMDMHNNAQGRSCSGNCDTCARTKLAAGNLRVLDPSGAVVPSGGTAGTGTAAPTGKPDYY